MHIGNRVCVFVYVGGMYVHVYICGIYQCMICVFHVGVRSQENRGEVSPHL